MRKNTLKTIFTVLGFLFLSSLSAQAPIVYTTSAPGAWNVAGTWDANGVPPMDATTNRNININHAVTNTVDITFDANKTVNLTIGAAGSLTGAFVLTMADVSNNLVVNGSIDITTLTFLVSAKKTPTGQNNGTITVTNLNINSGTLTNDALGQINANNIDVVGGTITNMGTILYNTLSGTITNSGAGTDSGTLPIELLDFNSVVDNSNVVLNWSTASEINNDYFTVERSTDLENFNVVGVVQGAGNSNEIINYTLADNQAVSGVTYYRLKQTDFNGDYTYSDVVSVESGSVMNKLKVSNIVNDGSTLSFYLNGVNNSQINYSLISYDGRVIISNTITPSENNHHLTLNTDNLAAGIYLVNITSVNDKETLKVLIR